VKKHAALGVALALAGFAFCAPALAQPTAAEEARELYRQGARLYNLGQFEAALAAFEHAYALSGAKPLLFNIAQAHRLAGPGHCESALRAYTAYLREEPNPSNAEEVRGRIDEMKRCAEQEQKARNTAENAGEAEPSRKPAADAPAPSAKQPAEPPPRTRTLAPILTTATGAALAITGGVLYFRARSKFNEVKDSCPCPEGRFSNWQTVTTASYALLAVGGTALVGGAIWWALDRKQPEASSYALALEPGGLRFVGVF
jgi:tetratricopeptide (TPR) repeat protein